MSEDRPISRQGPGDALLDATPEVRLIEAERAIERIEKLMAGDTLEELSLTPSGQTASKFRKWAAVSLMKRLWAGLFTDKFAGDRFNSLGMLAAVAIVSAGVGGVTGAFLFSLIHSKSHRGKISIVSGIAPEMTPGRDTQTSGARVSLKKGEDMVSPKIPSPPTSSAVSSFKPAPRETATMPAPSPGPDSGSEPPVPSPAASGASPDATPASKATPSAERNSAAVKAESVSDPARDQAMQEINFAEEVLGSLRATTNPKDISQANKALGRARELLGSGRYADAAKLARETAEQLLVGGQ
ncbi:MAG: hypothetical protein HY547_03825 [Elusimicrobia bacterium]|nr:hypothetical protein [Elusimicrobiota bacterium]